MSRWFAAEADGEEWKEEKKKSSGDGERCEEEDDDLLTQLGFSKEGNDPPTSLALSPKAEDGNESSEKRHEKKKGEVDGEREKAKKDDATKRTAPSFVFFDRPPITARRQVTRPVVPSPVRAAHRIIGVCVCFVFVCVPKKEWW